MADRRGDPPAPGRLAARCGPTRSVQRDLGQTRPAQRHGGGAGAPASLPDREDAGVVARAGRLGVTAAQHHERIDGSGYPRNLGGDSMTAPGKLLAAADGYAGKLEPRPHRPVLTATEAARYLQEEVRAGRQDAQSVSAVL